GGEAFPVRDHLPDERKHLMTAVAVARNRGNAHQRLRGFKKRSGRSLREHVHILSNSSRFLLSNSSSVRIPSSRNCPGFLIWSGMETVVVAGRSAGATPTGSTDLTGWEVSDARASVSPRSQAR